MQIYLPFPFKGIRRRFYAVFAKSFAHLMLSTYMVTFCLWMSFFPNTIYVRVIYISLMPVIFAHLIFWQRFICSQFESPFSFFTLKFYFYSPSLSNSFFISFSIPFFSSSKCICISLSLYLYLFTFLCISLNLYLSLYLCISLSLYFSISLSLYLSISVSLYLSISVSLYLCISLSLYLSISLSLYLPISLSPYLSISLSLYLFTVWCIQMGIIF